MPRRKQEAVEVKPKAKPRRIAVRSTKRAVKINQEELDRIKAIVEQEEREVEEDLKKELSMMMDDRELKMSRELNHQNNKNKKMIMWIGVTLFMLSIVSFWVSSLDVTINSPYTKSGKQIDQKSLAEYKDNLDKTFQEVMVQIDQLKEQTKQTENQATGTATSTATSTPELEQANPGLSGQQ